MKKNLLIAGAMLLIMTAFSFSTVQAQTCVMPPSCDDLGYTMTEADCASAEKILKCPHDQSKMFCLTMAEIDPGSSGNAGDILYEDHTTRADYVYMVDNRPIGVVFDPVNRLAVSLDEQKKYWTEGRYCFTESDMYCMSYVEDLYLNELACEESNVLSCGKSGKENTEIIMQKQTEIENKNASNQRTYFPAANYCYKYQPKSVSSVKSWFATGQWFLPNMAELYILYQNKDAVNAALAKLNRPTLGCYWSSNQATTDKDKAWIFCIPNGEKYFNTKSSNINSLPVLAF